MTGTSPYWKPEIDSEEDRWLCEFCGSELHTECVDDKCPVCGAPVPDDKYIDVEMISTEVEPADAPEFDD
jgi:Zn finger protein HypA/HybF involved in hydrogenase expression